MTTKKECFEVSIKLRLGTAEDFRKSEWYLTNDGVGAFKFVPKNGQCYWVKNNHCPGFMNRHYTIDQDTNWEEFRAFLKQDMIYVPVNDAWLKDFEVKVTQSNAIAS